MQIWARIEVRGVIATVTIGPVTKISQNVTFIVELYYYIIILLY